MDVWFEVDGYKDVIKQAWDREVNSGHRDCKDKIERTQVDTETLERASSQ